MAEIYVTGTCKSCIYFVAGFPVGECRRFPKPYSCSQNHWCGEQKENEAMVIPPMPLETLPVIESKPRRGRPRKNEVQTA